MGGVLFAAAWPAQSWASTRFLVTGTFAPGIVAVGLIAKENGPWTVLPIVIISSALVQAGEEVGWRGYALPRLARRAGFVKAAVLLGVM